MNMKSTLGLLLIMLKYILVLVDVLESDIHTKTLGLNPLLMTVTYVL